MLERGEAHNVEIIALMYTIHPWGQEPKVTFELLGSLLKLFGQSSQVVAYRRS